MLLKLLIMLARSLCCCSPRGNKDYGESGLHGSSDSRWFEEESPFNSPEGLEPRAFTAVKVFEYAEYFHAALFRLWMVYGRMGSYYGYVLGQAALMDRIVAEGGPDCDVAWCACG